MSQHSAYVFFIRWFSSIYSFCLASTSRTRCIYKIQILQTIFDIAVLTKVKFWTRALELKKSIFRAVFPFPLVHIEKKNFLQKQNFFTFLIVKIVKHCENFNSYFPSLIGHRPKKEIKNKQVLILILNLIRSKSQKF